MGKEKGKTNILHFSIDGEWFTDFVRTRYWYEGLTYAEAFELLKSCLASEDEPDNTTKKLIHGILTGSKKLVDINFFQVEDDNKEEEYAQYLNREERKAQQKLLEEDVRLFPEKYIDFTATHRSMYAYENSKLIRNLCTDELGHFNWYRYFVKDDNANLFCSSFDYDSDEQLYGGCYPIIDGLVCTILDKPIKCSQDSVEYMEKLYKYWEKWLTPENKELYPQKYARVVQRQNCAEAQCRRENEKHKKANMSDKEFLAYMKGTKEEAIHCQIKEPEIVKVEIWDSTKQYIGFDKPVEYYALSNQDILSQYGIVDTQGNYYACGFGDHTSLANHLVNRNPELFKQCCQKYGKDKDLGDVFDVSLDFLFDKGYIAMRNPWGGGFAVDLGKYKSEDELPQKILDTVWDWRIRYNEEK